MTVPDPHHGRCSGVAARCPGGGPLGVGVGAVVLAAVLLLAACAPGATPAVESEADGPPAPTVEERRLDGPVPQEILVRSGFDDVAPALSEALQAAGSYDEAEQAVVAQGQALWQRAVDRAQGRGPQVGDVSVDDDRPLYWARLGMSTALRTWEPQAVDLDVEQRSRLLQVLETSSRGQDTIAFPETDDVVRVLVTGFDPFTLDEDPRTSNPSGAAALALDGTTVESAAGPVRVEAAMFPVLWTDFARGDVERTLAPHLPQVDLFATMSQGSPEQFDLERFNGAWRGGSPDNENLTETGLAPVADPASQPQWTTSTLPHPEIVAADTGRFPVVDNTEVTEVPAGEQEPVGRPDGPSPGSQARAGGGGDYLSNEIAYRATLLRDRLGLGDRLPGGHVHTPVLFFGADNGDPATGTITDDEFVRNRLDIVDQSRAIVIAAVEATATP